MNPSWRVEIVLSQLASETEALWLTLPFARCPADSRHPPLTPQVDTAIVLRAVATGGRGPEAMTVLGIAAVCLAWSAAAAWAWVQCCMRLSWPARSSSGQGRSILSGDFISNRTELGIRGATSSIVQLPKG